MQASDDGEIRGTMRQFDGLQGKWPQGAYKLRLVDGKNTVLATSAKFRLRSRTDAEQHLLTVKHQPTIKCVVYWQRVGCQYTLPKYQRGMTMRLVSELTGAYVGDEIKVKRSAPTVAAESSFKLVNGNHNDMTTGPYYVIISAKPLLRSRRLVYKS